MKSLIPFENKHEKFVMEWIESRLSEGQEAKISIDTVIRSKEDLKKKANQLAIKRMVKATARKEAYSPVLRLIIPIPGSKLNDIKLEDGIAIPIYAPPITESNEVENPMLITGLTMMLTQGYDKYYLKLLRSFDIDHALVGPDVIAILDGTYTYPAPKGE